MTATPSMPSRADAAAALEPALTALVRQLPQIEHGKLIADTLELVLRLARQDADRLDWKILKGSLQDMQQAIDVFYPYRHVRKVAIFGSARTPDDRPEYAAAAEFARRMTRRGFMVMTGGGGGIMQAGNEGAGAEHSFGLNIRLPFEQASNRFIDGDPKLIAFKYFFTRKLFFLRESDAVALLPGGFGTQDEAFECLTLCQTGKFGPAPIVLLDRPGGSYWKEWETYQRDHLLALGLISPEDFHLYELTDDPETACAAIARFYRIYHSSRYVGDRFVIRLKAELSDAEVAALNRDFRDILVDGRIDKTPALPEEQRDETAPLPRLVMRFNQKDFGRLYQLIWRLNDCTAAADSTAHPEQK